MNRESDRQDTRSEWHLALPLFERWLDADEVHRAEMLAQLALSDVRGHLSLVKLIAADQAAEGARFLGSAALADIATVADDEPTLRDLADQQIGAWRLERLLGVGGAGQVWLAHRCDGMHDGKAAVKLLRASAIDAQAQRRFAREGRLLAQLEHPHIARLLDVGQCELRGSMHGQRYLVLGYVDGERIDRWCDRRNAGIEARLRLFLQVCDAVAYAHANLIVHRDLKPSNILVQADGRAMLLDFGVAKMLDVGIREDDLSAGEAAELTVAGAAMFTPEYAAPEQFEHKPVTVTADVYSLGVVLYVLLVGRRPYGDEQSTSAQLARASCDVEPRRPSAAADRKTRDGVGLARSRGTTPEYLSRSLRGDLDTIVARALKKDPAERYASVAAFAEDIGCYLDHKPIRARADSAWYSARKFVRRHRVVVVASAVGMVAAIVGLAGIVRAERAAVHEAARAQAVQQFLIGLFEEADPSHTQGEKRSIGDLLDRGETTLRSTLAAQPDTKLALLGVLGHIRDQLGDGRKAVALALTARDLALREFGADSVQSGEALANLAKTQMNASDFAAAEESLLAARTLLRRHPGRNAKSLALLDAHLAYIYESTDRDAAALVLFVAALPDIQAYYGATSWELANQKSLLASLFAKMNRQVEAVAIYDELAPLLDAAPAEHALEAAQIRGNQGYSLMKLGRSAECEVVIRKGVAESDRLAGPDNNYAVAMLRTLGVSQVDQGEYAKASTTFDELLARTRRAFGANTGEFALNQSFRVGPMLMMGRVREAESVMRAALDVARSNPGLTPSELYGVERRYTLTQIWSGDAPQARGTLLHLLAYERGNGEPAFKLASTLLYLAGAQNALADFSEARASAHEAAKIYLQLDRTADVGFAQLNEALALSGLGLAADALALVDSAEAALRKRFSAGSPRLLLAGVVRAQILRGSGRIDEAIALDGPARATLRQRDGVELPERLVMLF